MQTKRMMAAAAVVAACVALVSGQSKTGATSPATWPAPGN